MSVISGPVLALPHSSLLLSACLLSCISLPLIRLPLLFLCLYSNLSISPSAAVLAREEMLRLSEEREAAQTQLDRERAEHPLMVARAITKAVQESGGRFPCGNIYHHIYHLQLQSRFDVSCSLSKPCVMRFVFIAMPCCSSDARLLRVLL